MSTSDKTALTVETTVNASAAKTWECWTSPSHIIHWNFAADTWQCPSAVNDVTPGGKFSWRMEAKDGSMGFNYSGTYNEVTENAHLALTLDDGRAVTISFSETADGTKVTETFEVEDVNSIELQRGGWQAILDNFKKHVESHG